MPIFEFQCSQCGHIFEELVMSGEKEKIACPKCRGQQVSRLISVTGSIKKSGFASPSASPACGSKGFS